MQYDKILQYFASIKEKDNIKLLKSKIYDFKFCVKKVFGEKRPEMFGRPTLKRKQSILDKRDDFTFLTVN